MGALNPLFLLAAVGIGVPLFLHLFQRQEARRLAFPALRYLQRTEREHARKIRFRQILLLLVRMAAVLLLVAAGARLFLHGPGSAHRPTALVIVLDNSMSSGLVVGQERALDGLKNVAMRTLAVANDDDRIWIVRAGEPWQPSVPSGPERARQVVAETTPTAARGDLSASLVHAAQLVSTAGMDAAEIHLLSDLQATAFSGDAQPAGPAPVLIWAPEVSGALNRGITRVLVGGGLYPLAGQRTEVTLEASPGAQGDTFPVPVRVTLGDRVRGAGSVPPGASLSLPLPAAPAGWSLGTVDADPDDLSADDRRYFTFRARPAPGVHIAGDPGVFILEAVGVLEAAGRLRPADVRQADAVLSAAGQGLESVGAGGAVMVVPPADATLLPALNRRLAAAGIPWRYDRATGEGEVPLQGPSVPEPLRDVRARAWYVMSLVGDPPAPTRTLARAGEDPWALEGSDRTGRRYLLLASPMEPEASSLPVSAAMVRFVEWFTVEWAVAGGAATERLAGEPLAAPRGAEAVRLPSGVEVPIDGTRTVRATGAAGYYTFLSGDSILTVDAVNPPAAESDLTPVEVRRLEELVGPGVTVVRTDGSWGRTIFRARQGPELWRGLLAAGLLLLLVEASVASTGPLLRPRRAPRPAEGARDAT